MSSGAAVGRAQVVPLPASLAGPIGFSGHFAAALFPGSSVAERVQYNARLTFFPSEKKVELEWAFRHAGALPARRTDAVDVSYRPTFVCEETAHSPVFYVGGFDERNGATVIERWTVTEMVLGAAALEGGGPPESAFTYSLRKDTLLYLPGFAPLKTAASLPTAQSLLLVEEPAPHAVWLLETATGVLTPVADQSTQPLLASHHTARKFRLKATAPSGDGYVIVMYPWRIWEPMLSALADDDELLVFRDDDADGVLDQAAGAAMEFSQYKTSIAKYIDPYDTGPGS